MAALSYSLQTGVSMNFQGSWHSGALVVLAALIGSGPVPASATATAGPGAQPAAPGVRVCGQGAALVRPASMILTCADEGEQAEGLHWGSWTATTATATGTVTWRECPATSCALSRRYGRATASYTLTAPARTAGSRVLFTRLQMHVTGNTPPGFQRDLAFDEAPAATQAPVTMQAPAFSGGRGSAIRAALRRRLSYAAIEGYWLFAGGPNGWVGRYDQAQIAAAITGAESSFLPGIIQPGVDYCGPGADRAGWGLWQITCGDSVPQFGTDFQILDPWNNAEEAAYKCAQDASAGYNCFAPWSTWATGIYARYLAHIPADLSIADPGQYEQVHYAPPGTPLIPGPAPGSTYGPPMPVGELAAQRQDTP